METPDFKMQTKQLVKRSIIRAIDLVGAFTLGQSFRRLCWGNRYVRAVNYHATVAASAENFEKQLAFYQRHYVSVTRADLDSLLSGQWAHNKPGILLSFDDGLRSNYEVAAPLLEKYGFCGWFFVPVGLIHDFGVSVNEPEDKLLLHEANICTQLEGYDSHDLRRMMNWEEVKKLTEHHVVGCHSISHVRLAKNLDQNRLEMEIIDAKRLMQENLNAEVDVFCWVGGEEWAYSGASAQLIRSAGYKLSFMTNMQVATQHTNPLEIQRTNIEADWSLSTVRFYLSGIMDVAYAPKRKRVARVIGAESTNITAIT